VAQDKWSSASSTVNSIVEKGKAYAADVSSKLQERLSSATATAKQTADEAESSFQKGANKAKARVNELATN
jgi:hypothetical protein